MVICAPVTQQVLILTNSRGYMACEWGLPGTAKEQVVQVDKKNQRYIFRLVELAARVVAKYELGCSTKK